MGKPEDFGEDSVFPAQTGGTCGSRGGPRVKITYCTKFQKFRYTGEGRPGLKHQDKDFLHLELHNMSGKEVQVQIVCFAADQAGQIHPNGLVGQACCHGVYTKTYPISKRVCPISIPYLRIERIKTRKTKKMEGPTVCSVLEERAKCLPSPYQEWCLQQSTVQGPYDTTQVCLGVIVTVKGSTSAPLFCLSNVIKNASEKTQLKVLKLSTDFVSAQEGGEVDIFTSEPGPPLTEGKCTLKVTVDGERPWTSPGFQPTKIYYNRIVTCPVPAYAPNRGTKVLVEASLHLTCTQSGLTISCSFIYEPSASSLPEINTSDRMGMLTRKRPHTSDLEGVLSGNVKLRVIDTAPSMLFQAGSRAGSPLTSPGLQEEGQMVRGVEVDPRKAEPINTVQHALQTTEGLALLVGWPQAVPVVLDQPDPLPQPASSVLPTPLSTSPWLTAPQADLLQLVDDSEGPSVKKIPDVSSASNMERTCTTSKPNKIAFSTAENVELLITPAPAAVSRVSTMQGGKCVTESVPPQASSNDGTVLTTTLTSVSLPSNLLSLSALLPGVFGQSGELLSSKIFSIVGLDEQGLVAGFKE